MIDRKFPENAFSSAFCKGFDWGSTPEHVHVAYIEKRRISNGPDFDALNLTTACPYGWSSEQAEEWRRGMLAGRRGLTMNPNRLEGE